MRIKNQNLHQLHQLHPDFVKYPSPARVGELYQNGLQLVQLVQSPDAGKLIDLDLNGLCRLLHALTALCGCEIGKWHEDCHNAPLDRWWVDVIQGRESDGAR